MKRYDWDVPSMSYLKEDSEGEWVRYEDVVAALAAAAPSPADPWQPIETAPKTDGGLVDIMCNGRRYAGCHYDKICGEYRHITACGVLVRLGGATHWMPAPAAPGTQPAPSEPAGKAFEQLLQAIPKPTPEERAAQLAASQAAADMRDKPLLSPQVMALKVIAEDRVTAYRENDLFCVTYRSPSHWRARGAHQSMKQYESLMHGSNSEPSGIPPGEFEAALARGEVPAEPIANYMECERCGNDAQRINGLYPSCSCGNQSFRGAFSTQPARELPECGSGAELEEAADLVVKISAAETNGERLALLFGYRKSVRERLLATQPSAGEAEPPRPGIDKLVHDIRKGIDGTAENRIARLESELAQARAAVPEKPQPPDDDSDAAVMAAWNTIRSEARAIAGGRGIGDLLKAAHNYATLCAAAPNPPAVPLMKCPHCTDGMMREHRSMVCDTCDGAGVMRAQFRANSAPARNAELSDEQMRRQVLMLANRIGLVDWWDTEEQFFTFAGGEVGSKELVAFARALLAATASSADARDAAPGFRGIAGPAERLRGAIRAGDSDLDQRDVSAVLDMLSLCGPDARRYQWLRDGVGVNWDVLPVDKGNDLADWRCMFHSPYGMHDETEDNLDEAIDAAIAAAQKGEQV